jgi:dienelactone hydrolase
MMLADHVSSSEGIYPSLSDKLCAMLRIPALRLDYRQPAQQRYCVPDVLASLDHLEHTYGVQRVVLVGWSYGGAPCFETAAKDKSRVSGVATIASQTAHTEGIAELPPRPVLLMHGTDDGVLSPLCSEKLYDEYGRAAEARGVGKHRENKGERMIRLFKGDDHGLTKHANEVEKALFEFVERALGVKSMVESAELEEQIKNQNLVGSRRDRVSSMERGLDLDGEKL